MQPTNPKPAISITQVFGSGTVLDTAGRVERFRRRYADKVLPARTATA